jgi:hypothetical protein
METPMETPKPKSTTIDDAQQVHSTATDDSITLEAKSNSTEQSSQPVTVAHADVVPKLLDEPFKKR